MKNLTPGTNTDPQVYISHEILELITDCFANLSSQSSGWLTTSYCGPGGCELGDKCLTTTGVGNYTPQVGTNTWACSYYSNKNGGCILPGISTPVNASTNVFTNPGNTGVLPDAHIVLLFWKTGWSFTNGTNPALGTADEIKAGVQNLISKTKFWTGLSEYGVSSLTYDWAAINSTTPLPATFGEADVQQAIKDSMNAGAIPIAGEQVGGGAGGSIYIVIVDNSAQYVTAGVQGSHGAFLYSTPPPNNVPTTNPPAGSSPGIQADQFGVTELYPTKAGGNTWFMPLNPNSDTRHVVDSTTFVAAGGFRVSGQGSAIRYHIAATNTFNEAGLTLNQSTLATQGYMQDSGDWTNVEMTCYYLVNAFTNSSHTGPPHIEHVIRGAKDTNDATILNGFPKSCEGTAYHVCIYPVSGDVSIYKSLQYTAGISATSQDPVVKKATAPFASSGQHVGWKTVVYNRHDGKSVKIEGWVDANNDFTWKKVIEYVDQGTYGGGNPACGGLAGTAGSNQVITWGGPLCKFRWDNISDIMIWYASIREIDVYSQNPITPSPPSNTPPTVDPTGNPPSNLPPTPPPPNQQPPPPSYTGTKDKFGVRMIYPTKTSGESWYISANGLTGDPRVFMTPKRNKETVNGDGSFHLANNDDVMIDVATSAGYSFQLAGGLNASHLVAYARQYLMSIQDWKNVEVTFFHSIDACKTGKTSNRFDCDIRARHGSHSKSKDCQAACYIAHIRCDVSKECKFSKRQWMEHRPDDDDRRPRGVSGGYPYAQVLKRWVGRKLVLYNIVDPKTGRVTGVKLEHYWNDDGLGQNWVKLHDTVDIGGWGDAGGLCNGAHDQIIAWGGPFISFVWDDLTQLSYKWLSVREIDTSGKSSPPGGPPSPSPGGGPPPVPPIVNPVIGPNIYNVMKVVSSVIIDDSGGCNIGVDLTKHKGQITLGTALGTNINAKLGAAYNTRAGERCVNVSSALYNQILIEVDANFSLVGIPAGSLSCVIRRGLDDTIIATMGSVQVNTLSSAIQMVSFINNSNLYTMAATDRISFEFTGGDAFNYVLIYADSTNPFNSTNSDWFTYTGTTYTFTTTTDQSGGWYSSGPGIQAVLKYNVPPQNSNGTPVIYMSNGGPTKIAEVPVNSSSQIINLTLTEIDLLLAKLGNPTGNLLVYILENVTGLPTYSFGTLDVSTLPDISAVGCKQFNFLNYANTHVNTVNSYVVVEYSGGDSHNAVAVSQNLQTGGTAFDGLNTSTYLFQGGSWTQFSAGGGTSLDDVTGKFWGGGQPPPPGGPTPPPGSVALFYSVKGSNAGIPLHWEVNPNGAYNAVGEIANDGLSQLIGKTISEVDVSLKRVGSPTGQINLIILGTSKGPPETTPAGEYTPMAVGTPIDAANLTTAYVSYKFLTLQPYALKTGDIVLIAATPSGFSDANNYAMIDLNNSSAFDGTHTSCVFFTMTDNNARAGWPYGTGGKYSVQSGIELAGAMYQPSS